MHPIIHRARTGRVDVVLAEASISSVNWAEVVQKSVATSVDIEGMQQDVCALGLVILPLTAEEAEYAGRLWQQTRAVGLVSG